jgi:hypothetical protein
MAKFLFQPDSIYGVRFTSIKIDIHKGVIKILDDIFYDFQLINTESVIADSDREEVLDKNSKRV